MNKCGPIDDRVMRVFSPGDHGSTFGGNPLAATVALEALALLEEEGLVARAAELGVHTHVRLKDIQSPSIRDVRGCGLLAGIDLKPSHVDARAFCECLLRHGVLSKDTHDTVAHLAPPLIITRAELDRGLDSVQAAVEEMDKQLAAA